MKAIRPALVFASAKQSVNTRRKHPGMRCFLFIQNYYRPHTSGENDTADAVHTEKDSQALLTDYLCLCC